MPFHELLRMYLMGGAAYFDTADPPGGGDDDEDDDSDNPENDPPAGQAEEAERWKKYALRLRKENTKRRREMRNLKDEVKKKDKENADLKTAHAADIEKAKTDAKTLADAAVAEAKKDGDKRLITGEIKAHAIKAGVKDVDDLLKIVDASGITIDDKGAVAGVEKLIDDTKKAKPHLFGEASTTTTSKTEPPDPSKEKKKATDMTPQEYRAARAKLTGSTLLQSRA